MLEVLSVATVTVQPSPVEINQRNNKFWDARYTLRRERMADEAIHETAIDIMQSEWQRGMSWATGNEFEAALELAANAKARALHQRAARGGAAPKGDALHDLITEIIQKKPKITAEELYVELEQRQHMGVIEDIDDEFINFKNHDGKLKSAKTSGLKHRLSRIKVSKAG
ncbi:hypothetical protein [Paludibacterium sp.]|uniref:hypothetical protein n=1 Tax=Paludibacterium sp. TaxID=1917523 RepID=UPI0025E25880|nr:hypothetical protein [Paludibacterium sp.]MBV8647859.1 hypothetical protein [Paludibacterium sp.]